MPSSLPNKFQQLEDQITCLRAQQQTLLQERASGITCLITDLNLALLDDTILTGMFLFAAEKMASSEPILEMWREKGERFRSTTRKAKRTTKSRTPQKAATPRPLSQSPHASTQSGASENA